MIWTAETQTDHQPQTILARMIRCMIRKLVALWLSIEIIY
jgi:hypothetical protein